MLAGRLPRDQSTVLAIHNFSVPDNLLIQKQQSWDKPIVESKYAMLQERQPNNYNRARLLAAAWEHNADWLQAIPRDIGFPFQKMLNSVLAPVEFRFT